MIIPQDVRISPDYNVTAVKQLYSKSPDAENDFARISKRIVTKSKYRLQLFRYDFHLFTYLRIFENVWEKQSQSKI